MHDERFAFGALPLDGTRTAFRLWAPAQRRVWLETEDGDRFALQASGDGRFEAVLPLPAGTGYRFLIEHGGAEQPIADPASREQRVGADRFSVVVDPAAYSWQHDAGRGRAWHETVLCELDAAAPGGFDAIVERLPALAAGGVTAIGIVPMARSAATGEPVLPFAPDLACGTPDEMRELVDVAHGFGLTVLVGSAQAPLAPADTASLLGSDPAASRAFVTACAVHWIRDYRVDGLWIGAASADAELAASVHEAAGPHRRVHLLLAPDPATDAMPALPPGFDARWDAGASRALVDGPSGNADAPPATAPAVAAGVGAPPPTAAVVGSPTADALDPAALAVLLLSPWIPLIRDEDVGPTGLLGRLLRLRSERLLAHLPGVRAAAGRRLEGCGTVVSWQLADGSLLVVASNRGAATVGWADAPSASHRVFASAGEGSEMPPRSTHVYIVPGISNELAELAERAGLALHWSDQAGKPQTVSRESVMRVLDALGHPCDGPQTIAASLAALKSAQSAPAMLTARLGETVALPLPDGLSAEGLRATLGLESGETRELLPAVRPAEARGGAPTVAFDGFDVPGYHRLELAAGGRSHSLTIAIAPPRAFDAGLLQAWGTSVQLHALRPESGRASADPGVGDFSALAAFAGSAGAAGAHVLAISPTHAGFAADAVNFSPYSPSSRLFHNVLFIDPLAVFGADAARGAAEAVGIDLGTAALPDADALIDWPAARALKLRWLRALFDRHRPALPAPSHEALRLHATFEALHAHFFAQGQFDWRQWPEAYQDPATPEVAAFAEAHADDVGFHTWLQHLADAGLEQAQRAARDAGMRVGLVSDLAIGMSGAGSHAWASRRDLLVGLEIGAPPDSMNPRGQSWGLTGFSPQALVERAFEPFLQTLRAAMRQTGGVRIDHVLGLNRLWLVPTGLSAFEGAYVRYPLHDFINLLILESHRQRAIVIGEDLGTVPDGFREVLADAGVRGMAVLWLERSADGIGFKPPADWSADAVAMTTTHDLATAAGWWQGRDIDWRERIGIEPDAAGARHRREAEREALKALVPEASGASQDGVDLAIAAVSGAKCALVLVPVEDLLGLVEQPNLPGTIDEHPNWRRRLPAAADRLLDDAEVRTRTERLRALRGG